MTASNAPGRRFLTTGAGGRIAGCHPVTVLRAIERGELYAHRLGRTGDYRIPADALNAWLQRPASQKDR